MPATRATTAEIAQRDRSTILRLRLLAPITAISVFVGVAFADQVLILDANPNDPRFASIHQANQVLPWAFAVATQFWIGSFLPRLTDSRRVRCLRLTNALLGISGIAWITWAIAMAG